MREPIKPSPPSKVITKNIILCSVDSWGILTEIPLEAKDATHIEHHSMCEYDGSVVIDFIKTEEVENSKYDELYKNYEKSLEIYKLELQKWKEYERCLKII